MHWSFPIRRLRLCSSSGTPRFTRTTRPRLSGRPFPLLSAPGPSGALSSVPRLYFPGRLCTRTFSASGTSRHPCTPGPSPSSSFGGSACLPSPHGYPYLPYFRGPSCQPLLSWSAFSRGSLCRCFRVRRWAFSRGPWVLRLRFWALHRRRRRSLGRHPRHCLPYARRPLGAAGGGDGCCKTPSLRRCAYRSCCAAPALRLDLNPPGPSPR